MYHRQLSPLEILRSTGEPFLRLPSPLENIIITPPRLSDAPSIIPIFNDVDVCKWLQGPPYPYLPSHADSWLKAVTEESDALLQELKEADTENPNAPLKVVGGCPVRTLRELKEDGTDIFLGDIGLRRCLFSFEESESKKRLSEENSRREVGDPELVWCVGYYIAKSHHGRGIMTAALSTILSSWAIPRMGVRKIRVEAYIGNIGSIRTFEKNGFVLEKTVEEVTATNCGQIHPGSHIMRWERRPDL